MWASKIKSTLTDARKVFLDTVIPTGNLEDFVEVTRRGEEMLTEIFEANKTTKHNRYIFIRAQVSSLGRARTIIVRIKPAWLAVSLSPY